jgi:hypothetical protein
MMLPVRWTGREMGASLSKDRCVRDSCMEPINKHIMRRMTLNRVISSMRCCRSPCFGRLAGYQGGKP